MKKCNLILTSMINYKWKDIEPFFLSLEKANIKNYECIVWVYNIDKYTKIKIKQYAKIIDIDNKFIKTMKKNNYFITEWRHILYNDFLKNNKEKYDKVLLVDIRDVIFQSDIFLYEWKNNYLGVAEERQTYEMDTIVNKLWIERKYGIETYNSFKKYNIICAGTIISNINVMLNLLELLCEQIFNKGYFKNQDQADMNYLIFKKIFKYPLQISNNNSGPIITIGAENNILIKNEKILNYDGNVASIIHQYDRSEEVELLVDKLYRSKKNASKRQAKVYYKKIEDIAKNYGRKKQYSKWIIHYIEYLFYRIKYTLKKDN